MVSGSSYSFITASSTVTQSSSETKLEEVGKSFSTSFINLLLVEIAD